MYNIITQLEEESDYEGEEEECELGIKDLETALSMLQMKRYDP